ncbi:RHS repeat protein, partial [Escherichia coli]|nr:RHS repeat protein [Escherichia coli]
NPTSITDTVGRTIQFNYDGNGRLLSITQARAGGGQITWATFGYGDIWMAPDFPGLGVAGPQNTWVSLLTRVGLRDGSRVEFEYTPFG